MSYNKNVDRTQLEIDRKVYTSLIERDISKANDLVEKAYRNLIRLLAESMVLMLKENEDLEKVFIGGGLINCYEKDNKYLYRSEEDKLVGYNAFEALTELYFPELAVADNYKITVTKDSEGNINVTVRDNFNNPIKI